MNFPELVSNLEETCGNAGSVSGMQWRPRGEVGQRSKRCSLHDERSGHLPPANETDTFGCRHHRRDIKRRLDVPHDRLGLHFPHRLGSGRH